MFKYVLGCVLCLTGLAVAFNGQVTVSKGGGSTHPDKLLQYLIGGAIFLVGVLFIVRARRSRKRSRWMGSDLPPLSFGPDPHGAPAQRDEGWEWTKNPDPNAHPADGSWTPKGG